MLGVTGVTLAAAAAAVVLSLLMLGVLLLPLATMLRLLTPAAGALSLLLVLLTRPLPAGSLPGQLPHALDWGFRHESSFVSELDGIQHSIDHGTPTELLGLPVQLAMERHREQKNGSHLCMNAEYSCFLLTDGPTEYQSWSVFESGYQAVWETSRWDSCQIGH